MTMAKAAVTSFLLLASFNLVFGSSCVQPQITTYSYTTGDATVVTNIAFVAEFTLKCSNNVANLPLYAEIQGTTLPAVQTSKDQYQVSWTDEISKAKSGSYSINLYDEEGYVALRKAMRDEESSPSSVAPLGSVTIDFSGAYQGPWVNSEFMAACTAVLVWYLAFSAKSKILS